MGKVVKVLIADDHPLVLDGVEARLRDSPFKVVARCQDGEEVLEALPRHAPDVLVLDVQMPCMDGVEILRRIRELGLATPVVLLTVSLSDQCLLETVRLGVGGIVLKAMASDRLLECLDTVCKGGRWFDAESMERLMQAVDHMPDVQAPEASLTRREREVTGLVARGLRNKQIAHELEVSEATVKMHLHLIFQKLGLGSRTELALFARNRGIA